MKVVVIPLKNGYFRVCNVSEQPKRVVGAVWLSNETYLKWRVAWRRWFESVGHLLALAPGMWKK